MDYNDETLDPFVSEEEEGTEIPEEETKEETKEEEEESFE